MGSDRKPLVPEALGPLADGQQVGIEGGVGFAMASRIGHDERKVEVLAAGAGGRCRGGGGCTSLSEKRRGSDPRDSLPIGEGNNPPSAK